MPAFFTKENIERNVASLQMRFSEKIKSLDKKSNSLWILRTYSSAKMILASTVLLTSAKYCINKNVKIVKPYLLYYSLLNCARSMIYTNPTVLYNQSFFSMSHRKIINLTSEIIGNYDRKTSKEIKDFFEKTKNYRELFSYKFPARGLEEDKIELDLVITYCKLFCEIAQYQSAVLENAVDKFLHEVYEPDLDILKDAYIYGDGYSIEIFDDDDAYRIGKLIKFVQKPVSIINTMTEGMVEDFFGGWAVTDEDDPDLIEDQYNPDKNWRVIFPVP